MARQREPLKYKHSWPNAARALTDYDDSDNESGAQCDVSLVPDTQAGAPLEVHPTVRRRYCSKAPATCKPGLVPEYCKGRTPNHLLETYDVTREAVMRVRANAAIVLLSLVAGIA